MSQYFVKSLLDAFPQSTLQYSFNVDSRQAIQVGRMTQYVTSFSSVILWKENEWEFCNSDTGSPSYHDQSNGKALQSNISHAPPFKIDSCDFSQYFPMRFCLCVCARTCVSQGFCLAHYSHCPSCRSVPSIISYKRKSTNPT